MAHHGIDPGSLRLILRLQRRETNKRLRAADGDGNDETVALRMHLEELESLSNAQNNPPGTQRDPGTNQDGSAPESTSSTAVPTPSTGTNTASRKRPFSAIDTDENDTGVDLNAGSIIRRKIKLVSTRTCSACGEDLLTRIVARTNCRHNYCRTCMRTLFKNACDKESSFPPRCCTKTISISSASKVLTKTLI